MENASQKAILISKVTYHLTSGDSSALAMPRNIHISDSPGIDGPLVDEFLLEEALENTDAYVFVCRTDRFGLQSDDRMIKAIRKAVIEKAGGDKENQISGESIFVVQNKIDQETVPPDEPASKLLDDLEHLVEAVYAEPLRSPASENRNAYYRTSALMASHIFEYEATGELSETQKNQFKGMVEFMGKTLDFDNLDEILKISGLPTLASDLNNFMANSLEYRLKVGTEALNTIRAELESEIDKKKKAAVAKLDTLNPEFSDFTEAQEAEIEELVEKNSLQIVRTNAEHSKNKLKEAFRLGIDIHLMEILKA